MPRKSYKMSSASTVSSPNSSSNGCISGTKTCCSPNGYTLDRKLMNKKPSILSFDVTIMQGFKKCMAELFGTAFMMFGGCIGGISRDGEDQGILGPLSFGLVIMIMIQCYGHISGAHFNPAVTAAAVIFRMITIPMAIFYFFAQLIGAILGYWLIQALTPLHILEMGVNKGDYGFCATGPSPDVTIFEAFFIEYFATTVLISLCCAVWDPKNAKNQDSTPLKFGLAIVVLSHIFRSFTGCSMNPVRTFAPAYWNSSFPIHWVYWTAPMLSAIVTTIGYQSFFMEEPEKDLEVVEPLHRKDLQKV